MCFSFLQQYALQQMECTLYQDGESTDFSVPYWKLSPILKTQYKRLLTIILWYQIYQKHARYTCTQLCNIWEFPMKHPLKYRLMLSKERRFLFKFKILTRTVTDSLKQNALCRKCNGIYKIPNGDFRQYFINYARPAEEIITYTIC